MRYKIPRVKYAGPYPACFDSQEDYDSWLDMARTADGCMPYAMLACADCTPEFKERMLACGRCENPHVGFKEDKDGFLCGHSPLLPEHLKQARWF